MTPPPEVGTATADQRRGQHRAKRGDGDRLREELLDAAEELLVEHGSMDAVSLRAIATRVGVTPPSIYLHFADKDDLFFCTCNRRFEEFAAVLAAARADHPDDPVAAFRAMGRAYVEYGVTHAQQYRLLFSDVTAPVIADKDPSELAGMQMFGELVLLIERGIAAGAFRDDDAFQMALGTFSVVHGMVMLLLDPALAKFGEIDTPALIEATLTSWLHGVAPRP